MDCLATSYKNSDLPFGTPRYYILSDTKPLGSEAFPASSIHCRSYASFVSSPFTENDINEKIIIFKLLIKMIQEKIAISFFTVIYNVRHA